MTKRELCTKQFSLLKLLSELRQNKRMGGGRKKKSGSDMHFALREEEITEPQGGLDQKGPLKITQSWAGGEGLKVAHLVSSSAGSEGIINKGQGEQSYDSEL